MPTTRNKQNSRISLLLANQERIVQQVRSKAVNGLSSEITGTLEHLDSLIEGFAKSVEKLQGLFDDALTLEIGESCVEKLIANQELYLRFVQ